MARRGRWVAAPARDSPTNHTPPSKNNKHHRQLLARPEAAALFPADVIRRAREFLEGIPGGLGAYSESPGAPVVRRLIAGAIERRDGVACDPDEIYMTVRLI